jgi:hypothetical protein
MSKTSASESTPLAGGEPAEEKSLLTKFAVPLALGFYIFVAVLKTFLTKALFEGAGKFAVGFSAVSAIATCVSLVPVFLIDRKQWSVPRKEYVGGFLVACGCVAMDLALTNIAMSLLVLAVQQCIVALNPAFTVTIESIYKKKIFHPAIYGVVVVLCTGPVIMQFGSSTDGSTIVGILCQLGGVAFSASKAVFMHSILDTVKKDLGTFGVLFWIDIFILFILVPWAIFDNSLVGLFKSCESGWDWLNLFFTAVLGGVRFFSQLLVLKVTSPTSLSCANVGFQALNIYLSIPVFHTKLTTGMVIGSMVVLGSASVYTYFKVSKILEKNAYCVSVNEDFQSCLGKKPAPALPK